MFTFHDMIVPVLRKMAGLPPRSDARVTAKVPVRIASEIGRTEFVMASLVEGTLFVFFSIAEVAALPRVVPRTQLAHAAAQNQSTFALAGIVGPAVGTFLYQVVGRMAPFIADAASYAVSVGSLAAIRSDFQRERAPQENRSLRREIAVGIRWLWAQPVVRFIAFLRSY